jgi:hypothetical protein
MSAWIAVNWHCNVVAYSAAIVLLLAACELRRRVWVRR